MAKDKMFSTLVVFASVVLLNCCAYELHLLSALEEDPGKYHVELDSGINVGADAYKFTSHVKKFVLPFETASEIITQMDAHNSFILTANLKLDPDKFGSIYSITGYTGDVLLDVWVKSGSNPSIGLRYAPINASRLENLNFSPVPSFLKKRWSKIAVHVYQVGVLESVVDVYVNCERIGRKITRSVLDLFAYKKRFVTRRLEFRIGQKGYGSDVYSRFQGSMQDLRLVFKRDIKTFTGKSNCNFQDRAKLNFIPYTRALTEPIRGAGMESGVVTELMNLVKDLRYDLTIQAAELKYIRKLIEGCEMCRVTNFCKMKPCYPGVHCYHAPKSKDGFYCGHCPFGSYGNGINCSDINECLLKPCSIRSKCLNKSPGYTCEPCPEGYTGAVPSGIGLRHAARTKQICTDIDECRIENGGCDKLVECKNTQGSFQCGPCPSGYEGDPRVGCRIKQYCSSSDPKSNPCSRFATCTAINGGRDVLCECGIGFAGNGFVCGFDKDSDGFPDKELNCTEKQCRKDNCADVPNIDQIDKDGDGRGDLCDSDIDNDGIRNEQDNCRWVSNPRQQDFDKDGVGDLCDNCAAKRNPSQDDYDEDGLGDVCDNDEDGDGTRDDIDNCPKLSNKDQKDADGDGIGDMCDNCVDNPNSDQSDSDSDLLGDICDNDIDTDKDGVEDTVDNCVLQINPDQADADFDGVGDVCDEDDDNDSIFDKSDNCPLVANKDQKDTDASGIGDVCEDDQDADSVPDAYDANKLNSRIKFTDFRVTQKVNLFSVDQSVIKSEWIVEKKGTHVMQTATSDAGLAVGMHRFAGVDFNGTLYVDSKYDDDYIGFVFSYQDSSSFYAVVWKKSTQVYWNTQPFRAIGNSGVQLKRVESSTGPGITLRNALWHAGDTAGEVKLLWMDSQRAGWVAHARYHWQLVHRPQLGIIRLKILEGKKPLIDTGYIQDDTYTGGRLGMYAFSQADVVWTSMSYRANDDVPAEYNKLNGIYKAKKRRG